jgi:hypothetical protein
VAEVHVRTLKRAAQIAGGEQPLAQRLRVEPNDLRRWLAGVEPPPLDVFLLAVDVVTKPSPPVVSTSVPPVETVPEPAKKGPSVL